MTLWVGVMILQAGLVPGSPGTKLCCFCGGGEVAGTWGGILGNLLRPRCRRTADEPLRN